MDSWYTYWETWQQQTLETYSECLSSDFISSVCLWLWFRVELVWSFYWIVLEIPFISCHHKAIVFELESWRGNGEDENRHGLVLAIWRQIDTETGSLPSDAIFFYHAHSILFCMFFCLKLALYMCLNQGNIRSYQWSLLKEP